MNNIEQMLFSLPGLLLAIVVHELAHGYVAYKMGDNTAKNAGRLTLNPLAHMDPLGFVSMIVFRYGWAKPVPINSNNFRNRKLGIFLVSIAGPMSNFILAVLLGVLIVIFDIYELVGYNFMTILIIGLQYNIMLGVFNLLPFPPLDGSKMLASLLPSKVEYYFYKYENYLRMILLILIVTGGINQILGPLIEFIGEKILIIVFKIVNIFV